MRVFSFFRIFVVFGMVFLFSCSLKDYTNQPVLKDAYDGPDIVILSPMGSGPYGGRVKLEADVSDGAGVSGVDIFYDGKKEGVSVASLPSYHLSRELQFTKGGAQTITLVARNRIGIERTKNILVSIRSPLVRITNAFLQGGEWYTSNVSVSLGGDVSSPNGSISRVFLRVDKGGGVVSEVNASVGGGYWSAVLSLVPNEDIVLTVVAEDSTGVRSEDFPRRIYQDSRGPTLWKISSPTNNASVPFVPLVVVLKGEVQDDKVGAARWILTTNNWMSAITNEFLFDWWGQRDVKSWEKDVVLPGAGSFTLQMYAEDCLGNKSATNSLTVTVDSTSPFIVLNGPSVWYTNAISLELNGITANATNIAYSVNGGPYQDILFTSPYWTNTISFTPNMVNILRLRAINATQTNISQAYSFVIDTQPPSVVLYDTGANLLVNESSVRRRLEVADNLSGITIKMEKLEGKWGYGGMGFLTETTTNFIYKLFYSEQTVRDFPFGAVLTNTVILYDRAGNVSTNKYPKEVYPALFVTPSGSGLGIASDPIKPDDAFTKAKNLGIHTVAFCEGTYNLFGTPLKPESRMVIIGGLDNTFTNVVGRSYIKMNAGRVFECENVREVLFQNIGIVESGGLLVNGTLFITNSEVYFINAVFSNNQGRKGSAVAAYSSSVAFVNTLFWGNTNREYGVFYGEGSFYYGLTNWYFNNASQATNADAEILLLGGGAVVNNHVFTNFSFVSASGVPLLHIYARDVNPFLVQENTFANIEGTSYGATLWMSGNPQSVSIRSNTFSGGAWAAIVKEGDFGGYELSQNKFTLSGYTNLLVEMTPTATNIISNIADLNNPAKTKATPSSTDNIGM